MQTRCPSWCDRVFLSASARALVDGVSVFKTGISLMIVPIYFILLIKLTHFLNSLWRIQLLNMA